jgi:hypothetical protein
LTSTLDNLHFFINRLQTKLTTKEPIEFLIRSDKNTVNNVELQHKIDWIKMEKFMIILMAKYFLMSKFATKQTFRYCFKFLEALIHNKIKTKTALLFSTREPKDNSIIIYRIGAERLCILLKELLYYERLYYEINRNLI